MRNELESQILNYRLQNIYDLTSSSHLFLLKFAVPDSKKLVIVDPGFRIHLTEFSRSTTQSPSGFVAKLRKHLKTRRLSRISLAPLNRLLVFSFSDDFSYHLVLEFFAGGNMILLDKQFKILSLQRTVSATDTQSRCAVGEIYPLDDYLKDDGSADVSFDVKSVKQWLGGSSNNVPEAIAEDDSQSASTNLLNSDLPKTSTSGPKKKKEAKIALKKLLYIKVPGIAAGIFEKALLDQSIDPDIKDFGPLLSSEAEITRLLTAVKNASEISKSLTSKSSTPGYIVAKKNAQFQQSTSSDSVDESKFSPETSINNSSIEYLYEEFEPFEPRAFSNPDIKVFEIETFNQAVDKYFSTLESTKLSLKISNQEQQAEKRLNAARDEKEKRVKGLVQVQQKSSTLGYALQAYASRVEEAIEAVQGLLQQGMDWVDIENLIKVEQSRGNPVANTIALPLNLLKNKITVILPDPDFEQDLEEDDDDKDTSDSESDSDSDSESESESTAKNVKTKKKAAPTVKVEIDITLSAWANSRKYFEVKKTAVAKQERTLQQADQAYKSAEKKIKRDLKMALEKEKGQQHTLHAIRETYWFEKFYWFLSSDGYLCIGGRDSFQNELLLRRYFKKNDIYVHCDVGGASVVIIKNHIADSREVPPATLTQAGVLSVATSKAWDSKMVTSAWWATRDQIPRLTPEGDIVRSDLIIVTGEGKHFLPPSQLDMGLGFLWMVSEDAAAKYSKRGGKNRRDGETTDVTNENENNSDSDSSEEEFPDTQIDSDEEFPDTQIASDDDLEDENDVAEEDNEEEEANSELEDILKDESKDALSESEQSDQEADPENEAIADSYDKGDAHNGAGPGEAEADADMDVGADADADSSDISRGPDSENRSGTTGKRISAAERRRLRKQKLRSDSNTPEPESSTAPVSSAVSDIEKALSDLQVSKREKEPAAQKPAKVRGKKGKLKKIASKYADQDEEERSRRMELLGTTRGLEKAKAQAEQEKAKRQQQEQARRDRQNRAKEQEKKRLLEAEELGDDDEEVDDDSKYPFDKLVPRLSVGDEPQTIVPVFAPWGALQRYKYKMKFQPGTVKKGKAVKDILYSINNAKVDATASDDDYPWPNEIALVRSLKEPELLLAIGVGRVKISIPGSRQKAVKGGSKGQKGGSKRGKGSKR
ncbi:Tae2p [Sugiyamaella lignohabitans]|uniref:Ribosome quality control complex subunit 2 n=1 Tax=Sugiyamaella lignohabitans TaxID=796027 RepID=A0A161HM64_9ASCO|nr:Tae2p [Sugiyamaella lignohabitans]ANB14677.1 Tae2p [Sugiyamaella lignohabitans]